MERPAPPASAFAWIIHLCGERSRHTEGRSQPCPVLPTEDSFPWEWTCRRTRWPWRYSRPIVTPSKSTGSSTTLTRSDVVRASLDAGDTPDQVARSLTEDQRLEPIAAIKALRAGGSMPPADVKENVHRNLPQEQREAAGHLWDEVIEQLEQIADEEKGGTR